MTLNQVPQTFEEWWAQNNLGFDHRRDLAFAAFAAGVASQQAIIDRALKEATEAQSDFVDTRARLLRLREAAQKVLLTLTPTANYPNEWDYLQAILDVLDEEARVTQ